MTRDYNFKAARMKFECTRCGYAGYLRSNFKFNSKGTPKCSVKEFCDTRLLTKEVADAD